MKTFFFASIGVKKTKQSRGKYRQKSLDKGRGKDFVKMTVVAQNILTGADKGNSMKLKTFLQSKRNSYQSELCGEGESLPIIHLTEIQSI